MQTAILWHRACSILKIGQSKRAAGWPDALNIEQLSTLHYPGDASMAEALLSLITAEIEAGSLPACGFEHIPGDEDYRQLIARFGATSQGPAIRSRDIPMVSRDAYRDWPARPDLPEDSPLHGWIEATPAPEAQREATNAEQDPAPDDWRNDAELLKSDKQARAIAETIKAKGFNPLAIPDGKKGPIEALCTLEYPELFTAATAFETAWKRGLKAGHWRMQSHASYAKRGKD